MKNAIQLLLQQHFAQYARHYRLPLHHHRAAYQLQHCRTATLGGHVQACPAGHIERVWYNSCKHRTCPQCNQIQIERWLEKQKARLLDYRHHHLIFTVSHELNPLWQYNRPKLTQLLFQAVRDTLMELTADMRYLGALPGFILALHTWGRSLSLHPHIHCLITDGGLDPQQQWQRPRKSCFLPARVVMALFRGKYLAAIRRLLNNNDLTLPANINQQGLHNLLNKLGRKKWNVNFRERYEHGEGVVKYLARYIRGGPLTNHQIQSIDTNQIHYRYYSHAQHQPTDLILTPEAFLKRYLEHVPDKGRQLVRSYGLYAHRKTDLLNQARALHGQPPVKAVSYIEWQHYVQTLGYADAVCSVCGEPIRVTRYIPRRHDPPPMPGIQTSKGKIGCIPQA